MGKTEWTYIGTWEEGKGISNNPMGGILSPEGTWSINAFSNNEGLLSFDFYLRPGHSKGSIKIPERCRAEIAEFIKSIVPK